MKKYLQAEWPLALLSVTLMAFLAWHEYVVHQLSHYIDGLEAQIEAQMNWDEATKTAAKLQSGQTLVLKPGFYHPITWNHARTNCTIVSNTFHGTMKIVLE